ncbi:MBL fold metallo-hydrolase [Parvularcula maris]|uniref:MBL fold metallo-hydrolase n=1 Tax=Parvularcula maris TaxID=2965077 RepID=A0A9X2L7E8_9PROT|nr:MBL fold metallo-hydrolase [Parvularcula maris]MCQ8184463.1 MBL fold metallo-hydrolase [Parvularcula maris]
MAIPFVKDFTFEYEKLERVTDRISRLVARNPGSFTYTGTGVYVIGDRDVAVIDPGPDTEEHFEALKAALEGKTVTHVLVTHSHMDHSPLAKPLADWAGCKVYAKGPAFPTASQIRMEAGDDLSFDPDVVIGDGWTCSGDGWTIEAIETPGHTANHVCYALREESALFSGDHIMGWSTSIVSPPDGSMEQYLDSLRKVQKRDFDTIYPSHGAPITDDPGGFIEAYIAHRKKREASILAALEAGDRSITDIVRRVYTDVDSSLHPAACHSVLAHMIHLCELGTISSSHGEARIDSSYTLLQAEAVA